MNSNVLASATFAAICGLSSAMAVEPADTIYFNGSIVTMIKDGDRVEALAVSDGKIMATGAKEGVMKLKGPETEIVDLQEKCLMPGFVDGHSHVAFQSLKFSTVNLDPHPIGDIKTIEDIQKKLNTALDEKKLEKGKWLFGWGYDDTGLKEMRHPNRHDLDVVSTDHPILLVHISSHLAACNTKALELIGYTADTPDPDGGVIRREKDGQTPNGVLEEIAWMGAATRIPSPSPDKVLEMFEKGLEYYAAAGITTANDGATTPGIAKVLNQMEAKGMLPIDVVSYSLYKASNEDTVQEIARKKGQGGRLKLGGIKLVLDGSIQGYTAFLSQPYHVLPKGLKSSHSCPCGGHGVENLFLSEEIKKALHSDAQRSADDKSRGYASMTQEDVEKWVRMCGMHNVQIHAHCNGDAAAEMFLNALDAVYRDRPRPELRNVIIHCQTIREDQLNRAATHGIVPSFFPIHNVFWGDRHRDLFLGPERAARINPARSALDRKMTIALHHDAPIAGIDMLPVASAAINRITTGGKVLGSEQRITAYEALRGITIDAAYSVFEDHRKGTLQPGKLADLVILDKDPLAVEPTAIETIKVFETIKEGRSVYQRAK